MVCSLERRFNVLYNTLKGFMCLFPCSWRWFLLAAILSLDAGKKVLLLEAGVLFRMYAIVCLPISFICISP